MINPSLSFLNTLIFWNGKKNIIKIYGKGPGMEQLVLISKEQDVQSIVADLCTQFHQIMLTNNETVAIDVDSLYIERDPYSSETVLRVYTEVIGKDDAYYESIASVCHEVNRAYCAAIGDTSQVAWNDAPEWQKSSAIQGVKFRIKNPDTTAEQMHQNWLRVKVAEGWVYGEVKDAEKKTHHCMRPYSELPLEQKVKDHLFSTVVVNLVDILG